MGRMRLKRRKLVPAWHWRITQKSLDRRSIVEGNDCLLPTVPSRGNDRQTSAGPEPIGARERSVLWHVNS